MKRSSLVRGGGAVISEIGRAALRLAVEEGLHAHGRSMAIRLYIAQEDPPENG